MLLSNLKKANVADALDVEILSVPITEGTAKFALEESHEAVLEGHLIESERNPV